ncbi:LCP family protein [Vagococcus lutrae]|uniref:LCP family glycopolymer transferase n=1 Tax=Vagococcus lutrae TaxID=81947 RepID=UPI002890DA0A|nr:LCP family protein [Vagococcus lutrae]MDT2802008.1 LCP family protein [Vagococcus lutrae]MDT2825981.1 LCP family protein [Vagococcus lutrae]
MSTGKKILLSILGVIVVLLVAVGGYLGKVYFDVKKTADGVYEESTRIKSQLREKPVSVKQGEAMSILLLGIDTGEFDRTEQGRSDSMMIATVNPDKKQTTIISIPRDTYTEIVGLGTLDKLNHAYAFGGAEMSMDSTEKLLGVPIDHYVSVNMHGLKEMVDAVGKIQLENNIEFTQSGYEFHQGPVQLDGDAALAYIRMRYDDPNGDYGRQERQRKVVMAIIKKAMSPSIIANYGTILSTLEDHVKTDIPWSQMTAMQSKYWDAFSHIENDQLQGVGAMREGVSYQDISPEELARVQALLKEQLDLP